MYKPNYKNGIVNVVNSVLKHYGAETRHEGHQLIDRMLGEKEYKNVILMVFDGMGSDMIAKNLEENSFLSRNKKEDISSVYPCTTVAAMTSYYTGLTPLEHGWVGWACYFKEYSRIVEMFTNNDYYTRNPVGEKSAANTLMPYETIYSKIAKATGEKVKVSTIFPNFDPEGVEDTEEMCERIKKLCSENERNFINTYWYEPDSSMHEFGCYSKEAKDLMIKFDKQMEELCNSLMDTLIIISADHGQININKEVMINEIPELDECLIMPPSIEARAASFFVKPHMKDKFKERFEKHFADSYVLLSKEEVYKENLLGVGEAHRKVDDFIGDFFACATSDTMISYSTLNSLLDFKFKGHHAGLLKGEMEIPLIVISK